MLILSLGENVQIGSQDQVVTGLVSSQVDKATPPKLLTGVDTGCTDRGDAAFTFIIKLSLSYFANMPQHAMFTILFFLFLYFFHHFTLNVIIFPSGFNGTFSVVEYCKSCKKIKYGNNIYTLN